MSLAVLNQKDSNWTIPPPRLLRDGKKKQVMPRANEVLTNGGHEEDKHAEQVREDDAP